RFAAKCEPALWRNGRRGGFRCLCPKGREGSSPSGANLLSRRRTSGQNHLPAASRRRRRARGPPVEMERPIRPGLLLWRNGAVVAPCLLLNTGVYLFLNHFPLRPSQQLPLTVLDQWIPFWTWTVWPYLILLTSDVVLPLFVRDRALFRRMVCAYALAISTAML